MSGSAVTAVPATSYPCALAAAPPQQDRSAIRSLATLTCVTDSTTTPLFGTIESCIIELPSGREMCRSTSYSFPEPPYPDTETQDAGVEGVFSPCVQNAIYYTIATASITSAWNGGREDVDEIAAAAVCLPYR